MAAVIDYFVQIHRCQFLWIFQIRSNCPNMCSVVLFLKKVDVSRQAVFFPTLDLLLLCSKCRNDPQILDLPTPQHHGQYHNNHPGDCNSSQLTCCGGCQPGCVKYKNIILVPIVNRILPKCTESWCSVVQANKEKFSKRALCSKDDLCNNWARKL